MTQIEINEKINEIERYVKAGHSQSPSNCRILIRELNRLRKIVKDSNNA